MKKRVTHDIPIEVPGPVPTKSAPGPAPRPEEREDLRPESTIPAQAAQAPRKPDLDEVVSHLQRLQAEFANYRKRTERERAETWDIAQHALIEKLVPVLDDFDRAIAALDDPSSPAAQGLLLIRENLWKVLADSGLKRIETRGQAFDPTLHEALTTQPVEPERAEQVLEELVGGYTFRNRLVRPARVCVGVEAPKAGDDFSGR